jgi:DNA-directed RNA polymerase specialized sigma24 family protein
MKCRCHFPSAISFTLRDASTLLAAAASSADPHRTARRAALRRLLEQIETLQVDNARAHGWSWQEIAVVLGVSRQAVHK